MKLVCAFLLAFLCNAQDIIFTPSVGTTQYPVPGSSLAPGSNVKIPPKKPLSPVGPVSNVYYPVCSFTSWQGVYVPLYNLLPICDSTDVIVPPNITFIPAITYGSASWTFDYLNFSLGGISSKSISANAAVVSHCTETGLKAIWKSYTTTAPRPDTGVPDYGFVLEAQVYDISGNLLLDGQIHQFIDWYYVTYNPATGIIFCEMGE